MSRHHRSTRRYAEKKKSIEGTSQLEIDRDETQALIRKEKKHKPSRRGKRGSGANKRDLSKKELLPSQKPSEMKKTSISNDDVPHFADRIEFIIANEYKDKRFINVVGRSTTTFRAAVRNCPSGSCIFTSDGIKVYPIPPQRLSVDKYHIRNLDTMETEALMYSELSEAIKCCRIECGVFDPQNNRVY